MTDIKMAIEQMEEIVSYYRAITSTSNLEPKARNILNMLKEMQKENPTENVTLCKDCMFGYQDEASLSLGTVRCSKLNGFKLENWYCGDGKPKED